MTDTPASQLSSSSMATREHPFVSTLLERRSLHSQTNCTDTFQSRTFEVTLTRDPNQLPFRAGDSLAIATQNPQVTVQPYIEILDQHPHFKDRPSLVKAFSTAIELSKLPAPNLKKLVQLFEFTQEEIKIVENPSIKDIDSFDISHNMYASSPLYRILVWAKQRHTKTWTDLTLETLLNTLPRIAPRLYSIASSPTLEQDKIILMIGHHKDPQGLWYGACSHSLCYDLPLHSLVKTWIHPSRKFCDLDPERDLVMIGAGTGLAPYRSFLLERVHQKSTAHHYLFFGERHKETDFYYKELWENLSIPLQINTAFSRDQKEKIYVQDRLWQQKETIWKLLEKNALFLLCGDAMHMAKDVESTLCTIASTLGKQTDTKSWLRNLVRSGQLCKDVY